jgi:succinate dehydrogenase flavin-adding protein (antitoxin of CptAB toxin-antitoxin module)
VAVDQAKAEFHARQCEEAARRYVENMSATDQRAVWARACGATRENVADLLKQTADLARIQEALQENAGHLSVLRRVLAPPQSQDQFALICKTYRKQSENELRELPPEKAAEIASTILQWLDPDLAPWIAEQRQPKPSERNRFIDIVSALMSAQSAMTDRRKLVSDAQEQAVIERLEMMGWKRQPSSLVRAPGELASKQYMHKAPFATKTRPQEVDIACGIGGAVVLAMECKVTNDVTNSIKRVNDVLKKSSAWQAKWGTFVETAALLQGVIAPKDVKRLLEAEVHVFWSHRLDDFADWLAKRAGKQ